MFIRPARAAATPVERPAGTPLLRGLLVGGPRPARPAPDSAAPAPDSAAPAPDSAARVPDAALVGLLSQLGELAQQGVLTSEEFTAAKARLLGR
ncbi:SHOCT domain-containing protein [Streptomyces sp. NPDC005878]|uniref:SHOCT domain-containing protein n=1 Tax=Streptomyces sp. NPDC005878 TaxID=3157077 RepID=UPI0033D45FCC